MNSNIFSKLRSAMKLSEVYYDTPEKIADAALTRIQHLESERPNVRTESEIRSWLRSIGLEPYQHSLDAGMIDLVALLVNFSDRCGR